MENWLRREDSPHEQGADSKTPEFEGIKNARKLAYQQGKRAAENRLMRSVRNRDKQIGELTVELAKAKSALQSARKAGAREALEKYASVIHMRIATDSHPFFSSPEIVEFACSIRDDVTRFKDEILAKLEGTND